MNDIMAAIGIEQLKLLEKENERRRQIAEMYREGLKNISAIEFLDYKDDRVSSQHIFAIKVEKRDDLIVYLKSNNIAPGVHYLRNDEFPMYKKYNLPNVEKVQNRLLSLPLHLNLTDDDIEYVINTVKKGCKL